MSRANVIVWDWDGTLVDSFSAIYQAYNKAREAFGLDMWSFEEAKKNIAHSARDAFPIVFGENALEAEAVFYKTYSALAPDFVQAKQGREKLLRKTQDFAHLVVSNKRGDTLRAECRALGWEGYFQAIIGSNDAVADKPNPAPVHLAYHKAGLTPCLNDLYIGDAPIDAQTAQGANLQSILLVGETHSRDYLASHGGRLMTYAEFEKWLLSL